MKKHLQRFFADVQGRFVEDALYIAGAVIIVIGLLFTLGDKIAKAVQAVIDALP